MTTKIIGKKREIRKTFRVSAGVTKCFEFRVKMKEAGGRKEVEKIFTVQYVRRTLSVHMLVT